VIGNLLPDLLRGLVVTLELTVISYVGAVVLGTLIAVCRVGPVPPLRWVGAVWVGTFRNLPALVLLVLWVFGLPEVGVTFGLFTSACICFSLTFSATVCEIMRAGIAGVAMGQAEAARAIGLRFTQTLGYVILPQAFRSMVQPLGSVLIAVVLNTSLAAAVGVTELTYQSQTLTIQYAEALLTFLLAAACYVAVALLVSFAVSRLERVVRLS
jgi:glutamate transport system permease protein